MNNLCADIGYKSINHAGEQLCGDHVDIVEQNEDSSVVVLADGLGSGVKASILSTLTSKIISTMMSEGLKIEECVETIAATLPVCSIRKVAYSTFTIIHLINNETAELIQYDNPLVILIRNGENHDYPTSELNIGGKKIFAVHGNGYSLDYGLYSLSAEAREKEADICLYGHTHVPDITTGYGIWFVNPGSVSRPRGIAGKTYAVIEITKNGEIIPDIISL